MTSDNLLRTDLVHEVNLFLQQGHFLSDLNPDETLYVLAFGIKWVSFPSINCAEGDVDWLIVVIMGSLELWVYNVLIRSNTHDDGGDARRVVVGTKLQLAWYSPSPHPPSFNPNHPPHTQINQITTLTNPPTLAKNFLIHGVYFNESTNVQPFQDRVFAGLKGLRRPASQKQGGGVEFASVNLARLFGGINSDMKKFGYTNTVSFLFFSFYSILFYSISFGTQRDE